MLGVPDAEAASGSVEFSTTIIGLTTLVMSAERRRELTLAAADFNDYATALVRQRRDDPRDDLITALLQARDPDSQATLSELAVISIVSQLIVAGHETTATMIANTVWLLLEDRDPVDGGAGRSVAGRSRCWRRACGGWLRSSTCSGLRCRRSRSMA